MALSLLTWEPRAEAPSSGEHFVEEGTLGFRHFKPSGALVSALGKAQLHMQGALNPRPAPRAPAFPRVLPSSPTPVPGCLFLQLPGCESLLSPVSVAAFEGIYKPRPSPCACLSRRRFSAPALSCPLLLAGSLCRCAGDELLPLPSLKLSMKGLAAPEGVEVLSSVGCAGMDLGMDPRGVWWHWSGWWCVQCQGWMSQG